MACAYYSGSAGTGEYHFSKIMIMASATATSAAQRNIDAAERAILSHHLTYASESICRERRMNRCIGSALPR
jgi:hypothetical protein